MFLYDFDWMNDSYGYKNGDDIINFTRVFLGNYKNFFSSQTHAIC